MLFGVDEPAGRKRDERRRREEEQGWPEMRAGCDSR